ncbi:transposase [Rhizobium laguerreae]|nr:transposase [Rhizobium laguerreae]
MLLAHKIALDPNNKQRTHLAKAAGTARFAFNWALAEWQRQYDAWKLDNSLERPSQYLLRRQLNAIKRTDYPWMAEVTKNAPQMAIVQLGEAFKNFWAKRAKYPAFRKKGVDDRFTLTNDQFILNGSRIRIPNLGWVRMREPLRFEGKIQSATISRKADRWFVSFNVILDNLSHLPKAENQGATGVDVGLTTHATLSNGEKVVGPKPHRKLLNRMKRLSRNLSRKEKGSKNRSKARVKLAKLHMRIADIRGDATHKLTTSITRRYHTIGAEGLNVRGMMRNRRRARATADMGLFETRRQMTYKASMRGGIVVAADKWFPSSKLCHCCGWKNEALTLKDRKWVCEGCGTEHDRDVNAAVNLENYAVRHITASSAVTACGGEGAGRRRKTAVKPSPAKQEINGSL